MRSGCEADSTPASCSITSTKTNRAASRRWAKSLTTFTLTPSAGAAYACGAKTLKASSPPPLNAFAARSKPVHILDIASGPGRYVLETMHRLKEIPISATLRDYQQANLDAARQLAGKLQLANITITRGDAFDRPSLSAVTPRPTIAIASGIYELFPDNAPVLRSLRGIADAMDSGGLLIYTCQPWHPQMEFIARTLTNREGRPWIMRRRAQAEMDALVRAAGFEKLEQEIDPWGIFTVSLARRVPP